ncbi:unnamed protein product [Fusarium venenatum]|uniref:Uncharacterized protein n=1 Tax=Fusarium venenatum TaxID=56646 RepID=A0A2L2TU83_9HYPO|nr:uncharacterized protein FVRRES_09274 [Fusarium venenatum]CEI69197.1 unnamed protein product [Fusarium venenatum]
MSQLLALQSQDVMAAPFHVLSSISLRFVSAWTTITKVSPNAFKVRRLEQTFLSPERTMTRSHVLQFRSTATLPSNYYMTIISTVLLYRHKSHSQFMVLV